MSPAYTFFPKVFGNTMDSDKLFMDRLESKVNLREAYSENDCDVLIGFVPIVSRAGTDIQAALEKIPTKHSYKRIILVVLHHTFDPHYIAPDSRYSVNRGDVFPVDCLYYEDQGLLYCKQNDEALKTVITHLGAENPQRQVTEPWAKLNEMLNSFRTLEINGMINTAVNNKELTCGILAVISVLLFYVVLPEACSFFTFLIFEMFLLIILVALTHYYISGPIRAVCIFTLINCLLFLTFLIQTPVTEQKPENHPSSTI